MGRKKIVREPIDIEELKKAEIEDKKEEIKELKKKLASFAEFEIPTEKVLEAPAKESEKVSLEKVKKLKCDFKTFKTERDKANMRASDKCEICGKSFKEEDDMYVAWDKKMKEMFICKECAEKE